MPDLRSAPVESSQALEALEAVSASHTLDDLHDFVQRYPRLFELTGAGISNDSGIPV